MNKEEFLKELKAILQTEEDITFDTNLIDLEEWDSLGMVSTISFMDKNFNLKYTIDDMMAMDTVNDLLKNTGL